MNDRLAIFAEHRARLFGIAYRMLASVEDANDVVQETYLHWHIADATMIRAAEGWLVAVTTRLSIDRLRRVSLEREMYSGDWLPEPIATDAPSNPDRSAEDRVRSVHGVSRPARETGAGGTRGVSAS
jgi:DNA-directed RNA polymerase specialized sigma24 family protein